MESTLNAPLETMKLYDLKPDFDPKKYELKGRVFGSTGGHCMVGTVQVSLSDLGDKLVWVDCNSECAEITTTDYLQDEDNSNSFERFDVIRVLRVFFNEDCSEDVGPWLPMVKEALSYFIE